MSATPREEQTGTRAVCDDAFEKAISASKEARKVWAEETCQTRQIS